MAMNLNVAIIMPAGADRDELTRHVEAEGCLVRVADHAAQLLARTKDDACEVAVLDFGGESTLDQKRDAIRTLKDRWPKVQLVVLAERDSQHAA